MNVWENEKIHLLNPTEKLLFVYFAVHENVLGWQKIDFDETGIVTGLRKNTVKIMIERFKKSKMLFQIGQYIYVKQ